MLYNGFIRLISFSQERMEGFMVDGDVTHG